MKPRTLGMMTGAVLLCGGLVILFFHDFHAPQPSGAPQRAPLDESKNSSQEAAERWQCPMHPQIISTTPGDCPICNMRLIRRVAPDVPSPAPPSGQATLNLSAQQQARLGLKTIPVKWTNLGGELRTTGRVTYDETRLHHVHTRYEAYVEHLYADFTGKYVRKGEPLVSLYSPELLAAENEYLIALRSRNALGLGTNLAAGLPMGLNLVESTRQKLLRWNISPADLQTLEQAGRPSESRRLYAPVSGFVLSKTAVHGMRVRPEDSLFDIVDLSWVWVLADVYEYEIPRIHVGQRATMTLDYWPERSWTGRISYIYPAVDAKTRTIKVRLEVNNARNELKADMYAHVVIAGTPHAALVIPEEAVLETGTRQLVFVSNRLGRLEPRTVKLGERAERLYEVRAGLSEGERVVLGAAFLLDSESRLQAAIAEPTAPSRVPDGGLEPQP